ncbi:hypothetical protein I4U23_015536 [Adineta vaga]|nr:hypothetical protein I4U23_015536 [Adineta vaga]
MFIRFIVASLVLVNTASACRMSHGQAASSVQGAGIGIWSTNGCSDRNNPLCTSLDTITCNAVECIKIFKQSSGCPVTITGATETGHGNGAGFTHWNGYKIDISLNACVDNYIRRWPFIGNRGDGAPMYKAGSGNVYAREKDHWDIVYNNPC